MTDLLQANKNKFQEIMDRQNQREEDKFENRIFHRLRNALGLDKTFYPSGSWDDKKDAISDVLGQRCIHIPKKKYDLDAVFTKHYEAPIVKLFERELQKAWDDFIEGPFCILFKVTGKDAVFMITESIPETCDQLESGVFLTLQQDEMGDERYIITIDDFARKLQDNGGI